MAKGEQAADAAVAVDQPVLIGLDEACMRLSEGGATPEGLGGFQHVNAGATSAEFAEWQRRYDAFLKQPA